MPGRWRYASLRLSWAFPKACKHRLGVVSAPDPQVWRTNDAQTMLAGLRECPREAQACVAPAARHPAARRGRDQLSPCCRHFGVVPEPWLLGYALLITTDEATVRMIS